MNVSEEDTKAAQQDLLKAKAAYQVRSSVTESVLIANPILKAIHAGSNASVIEQSVVYIPLSIWPELKSPEILHP